MTFLIIIIAALLTYIAYALYRVTWTLKRIRCSIERQEHIAMFERRAGESSERFNVPCPHSPELD